MKSSVAGLTMAFLVLPAVAQVSLAPPVPAPKAAQKAPKGTRAAPADPVAAEGISAILRTLKDPTSAQFQNVRALNTVNLRGEPIRVVCGDINAKNSFGGFIGFHPWIYMPSLKAAYMTGSGDGTNDMVTTELLKLCR